MKKRDLSSEIIYLALVLGLTTLLILLILGATFHAGRAHAGH